MTLSKTKKDGGGSGLDVFDSTLHKTHQWLKEIMDDLGSDERHLAFTALRAALHALRDRLTVAEVVQLGAQLPLLIRGVYYEGWTPSGKPLKWHRPAFLACIRDGFPGQDCDPEEVARVVFGVLGRHVSAGEMKDVRGMLPADIRDLLGGD